MLVLIYLRDLYVLKQFVSLIDIILKYLIIFIVYDKNLNIYFICIYIEKFYVWYNELNIRLC